MPTPMIFGFVLFLHDLFTAIWIGGLIILALVIMPAVKNNLEKNLATKQFLVALQNRLRMFVITAIFGLWITGILLTRQQTIIAEPTGLNPVYSMLLTIKHILIALMLIFAILRSTVFRMKLGPAEPKKEKIGGILLFGNLIFGIIVLVLSGFLGAYV
jgi:putative copper export protein